MAEPSDGKKDAALNRPPERQVPAARLPGYQRDKELVVDKQWLGDEPNHEIVLIRPAIGARARVTVRNHRHADKHSALEYYRRAITAEVRSDASRAAELLRKSLELTKRWQLEQLEKANRIRLERVLEQIDSAESVTVIDDTYPTASAGSFASASSSAELSGVRLDLVGGEVQPPPAPSAPMTETPSENSRFLNASTPDLVALDARTHVVVQVTGQAAMSTPGRAAGHSPIGGFAGQMTIDVYAPELKADGPTTLKLSVPAKGDSERLRFGFVAHKAGVHQIDVMAWNGSAQVAGVTLQITVDAEIAADSTHAVIGPLDMREPETGEYTLSVEMDPDRPRYRFQLRSDQKDDWPPMYSNQLLTNPQATYAGTVADLNAQARNLFRMSETEQAIWMRGMGILLFEQLVPASLQNLLIEHKHKIRTLRILSNADPTPWELLFLVDPATGEGDFLATSTTVARWRYGAGPIRSLKRADKVLVVPSDAPPQAKVEIDKLQSLLGGASKIDDLSALNSLLETGAFDLLHFAAHNIQPDVAQSRAYVPFGKKRWDLTFMAAVPQNKFKARAPLVFMNACTTSGTTAFYTEIAGWADRFLLCGSGAFIGTMWEVRDASAQVFSATFYTELLNGKTLGEAMQLARTKLREDHPGDPTPFAYTLYGNPLARLEQA